MKFSTFKDQIEEKLKTNKPFNTDSLFTFLNDYFYNYNLARSDQEAAIRLKKDIEILQDKEYISEEFDHINLNIPTENGIRPFEIKINRGFILDDPSKDRFIYVLNMPE